MPPLMCCNGNADQPRPSPSHAACWMTCRATHRALESARRERQHDCGGGASVRKPRRECCWCDGHDDDDCGGGTQRRWCCCLCRCLRDHHRHRCLPSHRFHPHQKDELHRAVVDLACAGWCCCGHASLFPWAVACLPSSAFARWYSPSWTRWWRRVRSWRSWRSLGRRRRRARDDCAQACWHVAVIDVGLVVGRQSVVPFCREFWLGIWLQPWVTVWVLVFALRAVWSVVLVRIRFVQLEVEPGERN